ncbi:MAG: exodeoxyribonuclease V subunit alpha [Xanthomonadales bacterium]|nr:exodeoxyribonuclease V subunit alpha [Xanthomonadales bacterium]
MRFGFQPPAGARLDPEWRDFDRLLYRWALAIGAAPALARCTARLGLAESQGHTALQLDQAELADGFDSPLVGDGQTTTPFVLDGEGRFYFWRGHADECAVATALAARCAQASMSSADADALDVEALFAATDRTRTRAQQQAVQAALHERLVVLTGAPGTGKTTTVLRILLALQRGAPAPLVVRLAAPTGKAAQRLQQAIERGRRELAAQLDASWNDALATLAGASAQTLHRLLEFDPRHGRWRRDREQPLAADVVVVDEASMLDLAQMRALLAALPDSARLVLVGDADQLASVAAGAVLTDVVQALAEAGSSSLVRLDTVFRATPGLSAGNAAIRSGDLGALHAACGDGGIEQVALHHPRELRRLLLDWAEQLAALLDARDVRARHDAERAAATLRALQQKQLLCALRESAQGVLAVNALLQAQLARRFATDGDAWFPGRSVMITRNDEAHGLFNGDVGVALPDQDGRLMVWFEGRGDEPARAFVPALLPAHEPAFAITIHKSQGSEYEQVAVLLAATPSSPILSRQLLYTAASRARQALSLWASDEVLAAALARPLARSGGLQSKLRAVLGKRW